MAKKLIALDDGHGMKTSGKRTPTLPNGQKSETGNFMHENEFNRAVVKYLKVELERNGFDVLLVAPTDEDTPLGTRTNLANAKGADLYLSIHANANTGKFGNWGGIETFVYPNGESKRIGTVCHKHLLGGSKLADRKVKDGSHLWVVRKSSMASILFELGFMDSHNDYKYLLTDAYRRECAIEIAKGVCEAYGVKYKGEEVVKLAPKPVAPKPTPVSPTKPVSSKSHTVEKGETFYGIAKKFGMTVDKLQSYNPRVKAETLQVGDVIHLIPVPSSAVEKPKVESKPVVKPTPKPTPKPVVKATLTYKRTLKSGMNGADVKALQTALNKLNFNCGTPDGDYGAKTKDAVARFQKVYLAYEVDGIAGKKTIDKINSLLK